MGVVKPPTHSLVALCAALALACACGADPAEADDARLEADGLTFAFQIDPDPPHVGPHVLHLTLTDASGAPAEDAEVTATTWMPAHGHGAPDDPVVSPEGGGAFRIEPVDFFMPGRWEVRIVARLGEVQSEVAPAWDVR